MGQPNIIFILVDDLGWTDVGCYGSSFYETPHIDGLARRSMRFTDAYAACPVCSPTRASILTGRYPARLGLTNWIGGHNKGKLLDVPYIDHLPLEEKTVATALRDGGYATWHVGKWHLGERPYWPQHQGFDVNVGGYERGGPRSYFSPYQNPMLPDGPDGEYLPDRLTDEAVKLIRGRDASRPFFLNLWYYLVHIPIQPKPDLKRKYEIKAASLGLDRVETFTEGEDCYPFERMKHQRIRRRLLQSDPGYAAMVQSLDDGVGRVLRCLDECGIAEETIVVFTSDNGGLATSETSPTCNAPLAEGKGWMYEGATREPLIVHAPGVAQADSICTVPVISTDFYPTMLELAGLAARPEQHCDGVSLAPLLRGGDALDREAIFWHYPHYSNQGGTPGCSVRCGDYKLIEFFEDSHLELYNLREDVGEDNDLAADLPDEADRLGDMLRRWRNSVGAKVPEANPDWQA